MREYREIKNLRFTTKPQRSVSESESTRRKVWENIQLGVLALTIIGQVTVGASFILGQGLWLVANSIALLRDFALGRPAADKLKNATLWAITCGLVITYFIF